MSEIYPIAIPKWGIEMVEGTVNSWLKKTGETVSKGEEVLEIESDKIANVWESPAEGILRRQLVEEGEVRAVGQLLGVIAAAEVDDALIDAFIESYGDSTEGNEPESTAASPKESVVATTAASASNPGASKRSSPVVRRMAEELGVNLDTVSGTGRNGRITQDDVQAAAGGSQSVAEETAADFDVIPFTATRKTIAARLSRAKQEIPHYYLNVEWEIDALLARRKTLNEGTEHKISINDLLVYCVARALIVEPRVNINVVDDSVYQYRRANIGIAIATDDGLYPVTLRGAEDLSLQEISRATSELSQRASAGSLTREDMGDASFTISNLGMFDIDQFTAIINPPMGAILALGSAREKAVVRNGQLAVATVLNATLSCDHRAIDGAIGAAFLAALKKEIYALSVD